MGHLYENISVLKVCEQDKKKSKRKGEVVK